MAKGIAYRRAQIERLKCARQNYWSGHLADPRQRGMVCHTPAVCSCWMCGNPRKWLGERTIQELRQMQDVD